MVMRDMLTELGYSVVGPFSRSADAEEAVRAESVDAAVLDINLDGEPVYPIADLLSRRGIPFGFVTGYGAEGIDGRFDHVPVLQRRIERQMREGVCARGHNGAGAAGAPSDGEGYLRPPAPVPRRPQARSA